MNSARTLADRFRTQRTDRIRVDGVEVLSLTEFAISEDDTVEIVIEQFRDDVEQALHVRAKKAELELTDHASADGEEYDLDDSYSSEVITLVGDQKRRIELSLAAKTDSEETEADEEQPAPKQKRRPVTLQFWNSWLVGDAEHAWTGNSGLVIEELDTPEGANIRLRLWCSDGLGDPQFDDLVVVVTIGPKAAPTK